MKPRAAQPFPAIPGTAGLKGAIGAVVGVITGIIGLGGGYALVPSFLYFLKSPVKLAIGTSMAAFVWMAFVGSLFKLYQNVVDIPVAAALGVGAAIGAVYGAKLVQKFNPNMLKTLFGSSVPVRFTEIHSYLFRYAYLACLTGNKMIDDPAKMVEMDARLAVLLDDAREYAQVYLLARQRR